MLIRVYSLEYGKYLWEQGCGKNCGNFFLAKGFLSIWMCTSRILPLEAAIMQDKVKLSHKKL